MAKHKFKWHLVWLAPVAAIVAAAAVHGIMMLIPPPDDLDLARTQTSEAGTFAASIEPGTIAVDESHAWIVEVEMADGTVPDIGEVMVDGGMPQHGHGLPDPAQVVRDLGDGRFEVEGIRFSMPGWWVVNVHVRTPAGLDKATFNFRL